MSYHRKNEEFNTRLCTLANKIGICSLAEAIEAAIEDDSQATMLASIYKISRLASDPVRVYCDAVRRVMGAK
jgi:hypothetical protein